MFLILLSLLLFLCSYGQEHHSPESCSGSSCKILKDECLQHNLFSCVDYKLCNCEDLQTNQTQVCRDLVACCELRFTPCCIAAVLYKCPTNTTDYRIMNIEYISCAATWRCCKYEYDQQCCKDFTEFC